MMAFQTFKSKREPVALEEFGRSLAARKAELGLPDDSGHPELSRKQSWGCAPTARNAGQNRTPSKRALLKAIKDAGGEW